jgi:hypothetical protein
MPVSARVDLFAKIAAAEVAMNPQDIQRIEVPSAIHRHLGG